MAKSSDGGDGRPHTIEDDADAEPQSGRAIGRRNGCWKNMIAASAAPSQVKSNVYLVCPDHAYPREGAQVRRFWVQRSPAGPRERCFPRLAEAWRRRRGPDE